MGKQSSRHKRAARERAAALRAQQEAAERRRRLMIVLATLAVVLLVVGGIVLAYLQRDETPTKAAGTSGTLSAAGKRAVTTVPAATLDGVGVNGANAFPVRVNAPRPVTSQGKPQILYVGAEYCPYCAALRWSTAVAMSRFGTWSDFRTTSSAAEPSLPPLPTISFSKASGTKLTSQYVDFVSYETMTNVPRNGSFTPLDDLGGADEELFRRLDAPPYVDERSKGAIPFISFGGKVVQVGGNYEITLLQGKTPEQVAAAVKNPSDPLGQAILGGANAITAATCEATGGVPATVCTAPGVKAAAAKIRTAG